jgi:hypothetical protein
MGNSKSFSLIKRVAKSFTLTLSGFAQATSLFITIRVPKIVMTMVAKIYFNTMSAIRIPITKITVSKTSLVGYVIQAIKVPYIKMAFSAMKQTMYSITNIFLRVRFTIVSKARIRLLTLIHVPKFVFTLVPIVALFYLLGTYDPQTLGTLDTSTLGTMDYSTS